MDFEKATNRKKVSVAEAISQKKNVLGAPPVSFSLPDGGGDVGVMTWMIQISCSINRS